MKRYVFALLILALGLIASSEPALSRGCARCTEDDVMCGPNCLSVVCGKFGVKVDAEEIVELCGMDENGTTLTGLHDAATAKGLNALAMKIGVDEIAAAKVPAIAHLWGDHFVVVEDAGAEGFTMTDFPSEPQVISREQFAKVYSGFALLVTDDMSYQPGPHTRGPDIRFEEYGCTLGPAFIGDALTHKIRLKNVGDEDLVISDLTSSCSCTIPSIAQRTIPPGGEGTLEIVFDTTGLAGEPHRQVYIDSNDPISPRVQVDVGVRLKPNAILMSTRNVVFSEVRHRQGAEQIITARDPGDGSLTVGVPTSTSPYITITQTDRQGDATSKNDKAFVVTLKPDAPIGELEGVVSIPTNYRKEPSINVVVSATVVGDIRVAPDMFFLGIAKDGEKLERSIDLISTGGRPLKITGIENPWPFISVSVDEKSEGQDYEIKAVLKESAPIGYTKGDIIIHTDNPDQPQLRVPLYVGVESSAS